MYIITNGIKLVQDGRLGSSEIKKYFENVFISEEIGYEKPSKEFFDVVAKNIPDFSSSRSLVIGDSLTSDILGGINAGIDTCWFNPSKKAVPNGFEGNKINYIVNSLLDIENVVLD